MQPNRIKSNGNTLITRNFYNCTRDVNKRTFAFVSSKTNMKVRTSIKNNTSSNKWLFLVLTLTFANQSILGQDYGGIVGEWKVKYGSDNNQTELHLWTKSAESIPLSIYDVQDTTDNAELYFEVQIANTKLAKVGQRINITDFQNSSTWQGNVTVDGLTFGYTELYVILKDPTTNRLERSVQTLEVIVRHNKRVGDEAMTSSAAAIMLLMFVNLGTVLDLKRVVAIFKRPIGPLLGFCSRYLIMPGLSIGLGALMFKQNKNLQLALLFTAVAPSGGIANICNIFLKGNVNLSLATTTVNSILALGMLPLWIYLMGPILNSNQTFDLPFVALAVGCVGLCVALTLGVTMRLCIPKTTLFIFRFLKPVSVVLSLSLVAVTVGINYFVFRKLTLMIVIASLCLPAIGYVLSYFLSKLLCRTATDSMTIGIETSILNMSLPIVLLQHTLEPPLSDTLIVLPITAALVSLILAFIFYIVRRIFGWNKSNDPDCFSQKAFLVNETEQK